MVAGLEHLGEVVTRVDLQHRGHLQTLVGYDYNEEGDLPWTGERSEVGYAFSRVRRGVTEFYFALVTVGRKGRDADHCERQTPQVNGCGV